MQNSPAAVTAIPTSQVLGLRTIAPPLTKYQLNAINNNTRDHNQKLRAAAGLPPAPSAAERLLNEQTLTGSSAAAGNSTTK